jgi:hypothetical protein
VVSEFEIYQALNPIMIPLQQVLPFQGNQEMNNDSSPSSVATGATTITNPFLRSLKLSSPNVLSKADDLSPLPQQQLDYRNYSWEIPFQHSHELIHDRRICNDAEEGNVGGDDSNCGCITQNIVNYKEVMNFPRLDPYVYKFFTSSSSSSSSSQSSTISNDSTAYIAPLTEEGRGTQSPRRLSFTEEHHSTSLSSNSAAGNSSSANSFVTPNKRGPSPSSSSSSSSSTVQHCVMCGLSNVEIPSQNKNVCKGCDSCHWLFLKYPFIFKFCKGCKNFFALNEFKDKPDSTKCYRCRERGRKGYLAKKTTSLTQSQLLLQQQRQESEVLRGKSSSVSSSAKKSFPKKNKVLSILPTSPPVISLLTEKSSILQKRRFESMTLADRENIRR